jgi:hypothetical protein
LVADGMTVTRLREELSVLLPPSSPARLAMLAGYDEMAQILGPEGASDRAAEGMIKVLKG